MTVTIPTRASCFEDSYVMARGRGDSHAEAVEHALHAFGGGRREHELGTRIARVRAEWDREHGESHPAPLQVGDSVEPEAEPDAFSDAENEIRGRVGELRAERQRLSLPSLSDSKARAQVAEIENHLAAAEAELSRVQLARTEAASREQAEQQASEQKAIEDALKLADELGIERTKAAKAADRAALQLGEALAQLQDACARQGQALVTAGRLDSVSANLPADLDLEGMLAHALGTTGAPTGWVHLPVLPRFIKPLS